MKFLTYSVRHCSFAGPSQPRQEKNLGNTRTVLIEPRRDVVEQCFACSWKATGTRGTRKVAGSRNRSKETYILKININEALYLCERRTVYQQNVKLVLSFFDCFQQLVEGIFSAHVFGDLSGMRDMSVTIT